MPYGLCAGLWLERSGFKTLPGQCIVFFGETLNFQSASLSPPRSIDGYRRVVKEAYEIRGGDNLGRLVFLGEIRTYLRGRTFACLHNSSIRDVGWENSQKLKKLLPFHLPAFLFRWAHLYMEIVLCG